NRYPPSTSSPYLHPTSNPTSASAISYSSYSWAPSYPTSAPATTNYVNPFNHGMAENRPPTIPPMYVPNAVSLASFPSAQVCLLSLSFVAFATSPPLPPLQKESRSQPS